MTHPQSECRFVIRSKELQNKYTHRHTCTHHIQNISLPQKSLFFYIAQNPKFVSEGFTIWKQDTLHYDHEENHHDQTLLSQLLAKKLITEPVMNEAADAI